MLLEDSSGRGLYLLENDVIAPEIGDHLQNALRIVLVQKGAIENVVMKDEAPIAGEVHIHDLDVGIGPPDIVLARQRAAQATVAALVVNGFDDELRMIGVVHKMEQTPLPHQVRT